MIDPIAERAGMLASQMLPLSRIDAVRNQKALVKGWLSAGGLSVVYGASNVGKTFVVLDLAAHVAAGAEWRGSKTRSGCVVYIAAEGGGGIRNRIAALKSARSHLTQNDNLLLLPASVDLHGEQDAIAIVEAIDRVLDGKEPTLIVVDTMARTMGQGDENSSRDMGQFIANLDTIRDTTGAHVLIVHHSGKSADRGARGSSALRAAVDTEISVSEGCKITCEKQRDMAQAAPLYFALESVELGEDEDGEVIRSAVVKSAEKPRPKVKPLTGRNAVAAEALMSALKAEGAHVIEEGLPHDGPVLPLARWQSACKTAGLVEGDATAAAQRKAFQRAKDGLLGADCIRIHGNWVWATEPLSMERPGGGTGCVTP